MNNEVLPHTYSRTYSQNNFKAPLFSKVGINMVFFKGLVMRIKNKKMAIGLRG